MRKNPRRILSPQRLPFRHPGIGRYKLNESKGLVQHHLFALRLRKVPGVGSGVDWTLCKGAQSLYRGQRVLRRQVSAPHSHGDGFVTE